MTEATRKKKSEYSQLKRRTYNLLVTSPEDALQLSYRILVGTKASKLIGLFTVNFQNISKKLPHAMSTKY